MTAIIYTRVSTDEQASTGHSLDMQEQRCLDYCKALSIEVSHTCVDAGVSGGKPLMNRAGGKELLEAVKNKGITHIVAYSLSRLFRDLQDGLTHLKTWEKKGISVILLDVGGSALDTSSAMGKMLISVMLSCNELERNITGERVKAIHAHKKENKEVFSRPIYGFDRVDDRLVRNEQEQGIIETMHSMRNDGISYQKIANHFNEDGIPTKRGGVWRSQTISNILQNSIHQ